MLHSFKNVNVINWRQNYVNVLNETKPNSSPKMVGSHLENLQFEFSRQNHNMRLFLVIFKHCDNTFLVKYNILLTQATMMNMIINHTFLVHRCRLCVLRKFSHVILLYFPKFFVKCTIWRVLSVNYNFSL